MARGDKLDNEAASKRKRKEIRVNLVVIPTFAVGKV